MTIRNGRRVLTDHGRGQAASSHLSGSIAVPAAHPAQSDGMRHPDEATEAAMRARHAAHTSRWRARNPEYAREWQRANRERLNAYKRAWKAARRAAGLAA